MNDDNKEKRFVESNKAIAKYCEYNAIVKRGMSEKERQEMRKNPTKRKPLSPSVVETIKKARQKAVSDITE